MKIKKYLIAGGNSTALVENCSNNQRKEISAELLKKVEQVGFISKTKLQMMGNELCVNGTLAFASTLGKKGKLTISGTKEEIYFFNNSEKTTIKIPLTYQQTKNVVLFEGIGFILFNIKEKTEIKREDLVGLCNKYNLPAFGCVIYQDNQIQPFVYVKEVDSFVKETACGSGSIALNLLTGISEIVQPTGEMIWVRKGKEIEISAKVEAIDI